MTEEPVSTPAAAAAARRPLVGYVMVTTAATLFALNGTVAKVVLASGISSVDLTQIRSTGAFVGFALALLATAPSRLRVTRRELRFLLVFGVTGVAFVQWLYFVSIHRLPIGIALLIQYLAPLLVALAVRVLFHVHLRRRVWVALVLALTGLSLMVEAWTGGLALDAVGLVAALGGAAAYALYILMAERGVQRRDPLSLSCYGFAFAALFWFTVQPIWQFPAHRLDDSVSLLGRLEHVHVPVWLLLLFVVVVGTITTFGLVVTSLRHLPATRVAIVAMLEPVVASVVAWAWLGESLDTAQLAGGAVVLAGIVLAQTAR